MTPEEIAAAYLQEDGDPLGTAARLLGAYEDLPRQPVWAATGGPHGPIAFLYAAADVIDRLGYVGGDPDWWHPGVRAAKAAELEEAHRRMREPVRAACRAIVDYRACSAASSR